MDNLKLRIQPCIYQINNIKINYKRDDWSFILFNTFTHILNNV